MPRDWQDNMDDDAESNESCRSRSPIEGSVLTSSKAREICNDPDIISARICVFGFKPSITKDMLQEYFSQFGNIIAVFMLRSKRSAFVQFEEEEEAQNCLSAGSTAQIDGGEAIIKPAKQGASRTGNNNNRNKSSQKNFTNRNKGSSSSNSNNNSNSNSSNNKNNSRSKANQGGLQRNVDFNDPRTADARVFVDPVPDAISKADIEKEMMKFGYVMGCQIQFRKGDFTPRYAFVQFRDVSSANKCTQQTNVTIKGYNMMVSSVAASNKSSSSNSQKNMNRQQSSNSRGLDRATLDPMTASARVYVGNIKENTVTKDDLRNFFSNFGFVTNISVHKRKSGKKSFAFVQFSSEEGAENCLLVGKNVFVCGQQLEIGPVTSEHAGDKSDILSNSGISPWEVPQSFHDPGSQFGMGGGMNMSPAFGNQGMGSMNNMSMSDSMQSADTLDPNRPNDAEIVVSNTAQRGYAEFIESQLMSMNMKVDMIFPPPGIAASKIITDLIKRKCLFCLMVTEENERSQTVTLHVLQGPLQAHCNIAIANAIRLIQENFNEYIETMRPQGMSMGGGGSGPPQGMMNMGPGMFRGNNYGPSGSGSNFGPNNPSSSGGMFGNPNFNSRGGGPMGPGGHGGPNSGTGILGPLPTDGSGLMGPAPGMSGSNMGPQGGDVGNMYSLVLDSVRMARDLTSVRGERDVKEIMAGKDFRQKVAALKAKASAVKQHMGGGRGGRGGGGGGGGGQRGSFYL